MSTVYDSISSPDGERDLILDLTLFLETSEVVTGTPVITASDPTVLEFSNIVVNSSITEDGVAVGKGILYHVKTLVESKIQQNFSIAYVGSTGTVDKHCCSIPVTDCLKG